MRSLYEIAAVAQQILLIDLAHPLVAQPFCHPSDILAFSNFKFFVLTCLFPFSSDLPLKNLFIPFWSGYKVVFKIFYPLIYFSVLRYI